MKKKKILVIDDEKNICEFLRKFLTEEGYEAITALSGPEGIEKVKELHPDVIILDLKMPEMDGVATLGHIRNVDKYAAVIILTGYPSMDTALKTLYLNVYDYVTKPVDLDKMAGLIREALGTKKAG